MISYWENVMFCASNCSHASKKTHKMTRDTALLIEKKRNTKKQKEKFTKASNIQKIIGVKFF